MVRILMAAALTALAFGGLARAEDTVESLKPQALESCKKEVGGGDMPAADVDKLCGCMVDNIVTVFGDDAVKMLKIVVAGLNPSQTAEIATLLGVTEEEAKAFVQAADEKMDQVQEACEPHDAH